MHTHNTYSMDDEAQSDTSDEKSTNRETPVEQQPRDLPATFSRHLVNRFGVIGHHCIGSKTVNEAESQN